MVREYAIKNKKARRERRNVFADRWFGKDRSKFPISTFPSESHGMSTIKQLQQVVEAVLEETKLPKTHHELKHHLDRYNKKYWDVKKQYGTGWFLQGQHLVNHTVDRGDRRFEEKNPIHFKQGRVHLPQGLITSGDDDQAGHNILPPGHYRPREISKAIHKE